MPGLYLIVCVFLSSFTGANGDNDIVANLETGVKYCVSDCQTEYDFVSTCASGQSPRNSPLCDNEITRVVEGRGGPGCFADAWYIVEACNEACYEFGWRGTFPTSCDVVDRWLWCCEPKITVEDMVVCGEHTRADLSCVVQDHHVVIEYDTIKWMDSSGTVIDDSMEGIEISEIYRADDDKIMSVLSLDQGVLEFGENVFACVVESSLDRGAEEIWQATGKVTMIGLLADATTLNPRGQDANLKCKAKGLNPDDEREFIFSAYYFTQLGLKKSITENSERFKFEVLYSDQGQTHHTNSSQENSSHEQSGNGQSDHGQSDHGQSEHAQSGDVQSEHAQSDHGQSEHKQLGDVQSEHAQSGDVQSEHGVSGQTQSSYGGILYSGYRSYNFVISSLTVAGEYQITGTEKYQVHLNHKWVDKCGLEHVVTCHADFHLDSFDATPDSKCSKPFEEVNLTTTITSYPGCPLEAITITSLETGIETRAGVPEIDEGYRLSGEYNEDNDLVVTLTVFWWKTGLQGTEHFSTFVDGKGVGTNPNLEMHIVELRQGDAAAVHFTDMEMTLTEGGDKIVAVAEIVGGRLDQPIWQDQVGHLYGVGVSESGVEVLVIDNNSKTVLTAPRDSYIEKLDVSVLVTSLDETTSCGREYLHILLSLPVVECEVVWEDPVCDRRVSCTEYEQLRGWRCVCDGQVSEKDNCPPPVTPIGANLICGATGEWEITDWSEELCDTPSCYDFQRTKTRTCECLDEEGVHEDVTQCRGSPRSMFYTCPMNQPWSPGPWNNGVCPTGTCFNATTIDTRECLCGEFSDRFQCEDALWREGSCPPSLEFSWSDWGDVVCGQQERCTDMVDAGTRNRICTCAEPGYRYRSSTACPGISTDSATCEANAPWVKVPLGNACDIEGVYHVQPDVCNVWFGKQNYTCWCEDTEDEYLDKSRCDTQPELMECAATGEYSWSGWSADSECSPCYPELKQTFIRECACGELTDRTRCAGPSQKSEACPESHYLVWEPTEWVEVPCGRLSCVANTFTVRTRDCECGGDVDKSRCSEQLEDYVDCGHKEFELSEWSNDLCDRNTCRSYTKTKSRSCDCLDESGEYTDLDKCYPGPIGYEVEFSCSGDAYDWGEWQSKGCPTDRCTPFKTKRYRMCTCAGNVDFTMCADGAAIQFYLCPALGINC